MDRLKVLFAASEVFPFAKSGGLADVAFSLPRALKKYGEVEVVLPLYRSIDREAFGIEPMAVSFDIRLGENTHTVDLYRCDYEGVRYRFVYEPLLCEREYLYGPPEHGYDDNALRFGIFCHAVTAMLAFGGYDLVHLNDWQTALTALLLRQRNVGVPSVYTIHNLAYQGLFGPEALDTLGIDRRHFTMEGVEFYGQVSFMKAGIGFADAVTTVSPTYAEEILTPEFGCGLEGYLRKHRAKLTGILNGIDTAYFSPCEDPSIAHPYDAPGGKRKNKQLFLERIGTGQMEHPLFIFIGRFTAQKGLDLLIGALPEMAQRPCTVAILGEGEEKYHRALEALAERYGNVHLTFGYDEALSHRMYAAADFLLMPSLYEPCGLNQMIAMRYGTVPVVRHTGGLADTVAPVDDFTEASPKGYGVLFVRPHADALVDAFDEALDLHLDVRRYLAVARHDMACDFSWHASARRYEALYQKIHKEKTDA
jgi:starch synthase